VEENSMTTQKLQRYLSITNYHIWNKIYRISRPTRCTFFPKNV